MAASSMLHKAQLERVIG
jgi:hypothetical protein